MRAQQAQIGSILRSTGSQAKLAIGQPNDRYEQEADRVADQVMRMSDADVVQRAKSGIVQPMQIQRMCPECEEELQRQPEEEEEELQAKEQPDRTPQITPGVESRINSLKGGGQPLDSATRSFFEPRFSRDFSDVRLHTGGEAADLSRTINARAFTLGNHVVMGSGEYQPNSQSGQRLLGHELTHVVQQWEGGINSKVRTQGSIAPGSADSEVLQRTPGVDAEDSWRAMAAGELEVEPDEALRRTQALEAVRRFLRVPAAQRMVNGLYNRFRSGDGCRLRFRTRFVPRLGSAGRFDPETPVPRSGSQTYVVSVLQTDPSWRGSTFSSTWGGGEYALSERYRQEDSYLASALHHEVTHVWFVNTFRDAEYSTGHGIPEQGEIDPRFFRQLRSFATQLQRLEGTLQQEQERARAAAEEARRRQHTPEPLPLPPPSPEPESRGPATGPQVGGSVSVSVGGAFSPSADSRLALQVGGDVELILAQIHALRVGVRGVYLTPNHLMVGGAVGYRKLSDTGPLYFDIEAGLLHEVTPDSAERLTNSVTGLVSAGFGGEHGSESARFTWQIGGFMLIYDHPAGMGVGVSGGPAGSIGASF